MTPAERLLLIRLEQVGVTRKPVYTPSEVQRILGISERSFKRLTDRPLPKIPGRDPRGLESYRIGAHRRVPYEALLDWWIRNGNL